MKEYIEIDNKKKKIQHMILFGVICFVLLIILITFINIFNAKRGKRPILYFAQTINDIDGSVVYNIFPYKITEYKNRVNDDSYIEYSSVFKKFKNKYYDPDSDKYLFKKDEYIKPDFDIKDHFALFEDVIDKVNNNKFNLGTNSNYKNIYLDLKVDEHKKIELEKLINNNFKNKFNNINIEYKDISALKLENKVRENKILDGIYISIIGLSIQDDEVTMSVELITNKSTIYSQKVLIKKSGEIRTFEYSNDFDQLARENKINEQKKEEERIELERRAIEERRLREEEEKRKIEELEQKKKKDFEDGQLRLKNLLNIKNLAVFNGKLANIDTKAIETPLNENINLDDIKTYNHIRINTNYIIYQYQEQIIDNKSSNIFVKERLLSQIEYNDLIQNIDKLTAYSGTGKYQDTISMEINYLGKTKNVLLKELNNLLNKFSFSL